jgi:hypothetical protein
MLFVTCIGVDVDMDIPTCALHTHATVWLIV